MATTFEVHLAIYDLSRGMARSLSGQFLGAEHAIDIIPHTGLVVFGKEYFFGGGVQAESPTLFRRSTGMNPISQELLGQTSVSQQEFETWCRTCMANGRFTQESYDLLTSNCNNFCQEAAVEGLRLPHGIPEWILDVPRRFLASPMGQMVAPMLQQMQVTGGHTGAAPFSNAAPSMSTTSATTTSASAGNAASDHNPWANLPSSSNTATTATKTQDDVKATPVLDSYARPLLSNDTKTATLCATKLVTTIENETDKSTLKNVAEVLSKGNKPSDAQVQAACKVLLQQLATGGSSLTFALMLLRLLMLYPPSDNKEESSSYGQCVEWIQEELSKETNGNTTLSPAARSMAWCCLSNAYGTFSKTIPSLETTVEAAIRDLSPDDSQKVQVRQAAAAFLYNVSLEESNPSAKEEEEDGVSDLLVSLLCACLDGLTLETDDTCQLRRLVVAAKIVKPHKDGNVNTAAKSLVQDLGFADALYELRACANSRNASGDAAKVQQVTTEFIGLLEN